MVSQTAEYALRAMLILAEHDGQAMITPKIADLTRVPRGYLSKVLQMLGRSGLVQSRRGLGGGFVLARSPAEISLLDVINSVDRLQRIEKCPLDNARHGTNLCPLHRRLDEAAAAVERSFAETTLAELLSGKDSPHPLCQPAS
jgi:Rrf2 family protein